MRVFVHRQRDMVSEHRSKMRRCFFVLAPLLLFGLGGVGGQAEAKSSLDGKLKMDDEINFQDLLEAIKSNQNATENLQRIVDNIVEIVSVLAADAAAAKAAKEEAHGFDVELEFTSETWHCVKECLRLFFRGCYEIIVGIVDRLGVAWNQGDFVTKSMLTFMTFNTICTIPDAVRNVVWFVVQVWTAYNALRSWLRGNPKLEKGDKGEKMNDSIESYEELTQVRRYQDERLQDFVDRLVTKWKTLTPKISDARFLRVLKQHFPREFLQGLQDLNLDEVKVDKVLEKWSNFCKWTAPTANRAAPRATQPTAARVQPVSC